MRTRLLAALAAPALSRRLAAAAAGAPPSALLTVAVDLGAGADDWLSLLPEGGDYWYWAQPAGGEHRLGLGSALRVESAGPARFAALQHTFAGLLAQWRHEATPQAFLGFAFDEAAENDLPNALLAVPALLLISRGGRRQVLCTTVAGAAADAPARWQALLSPAAAAAAAGLVARPRPALAGRAWQARVDAALRDIAAGRLDKVVLARSVRLRAGAPLPAAPLLAALLERQPESTVYAHAGRGLAFLGASPERLVRVAGGGAEADALAGTAWPEATGTAAGLDLAADKNRREQRFVLDAVRAALAPLCERLESDGDPSVLALPGLSHLRSRVAGSLRPGVGLFDLIAALHPTPAVGGSPGPAARDWLRRHGERRAAWYSGGIGRLDGDGGGDIAVALRCALLRGCEAELQAGAGIVAGSQAAQELAETEAKLATLLDLLCHPPAEVTRTGTQ